MAKGYLPISLITPSKLRGILNYVKIAVRKTNPDYDLVIDRLHMYYDMQLVTFALIKTNIYSTISSIHTTMDTTATDTVSDRNSTSSNYRPEHAGTILYAPTG